MSSIRFQHNIAIVVGINDYQDGVPILKTPVSDAQTLAKILQTQHGYKTYLELNQQANRKKLITLLEEELPKQIEANDRLLFYFAGHGIALNGEDGPEGYLIPQDAQYGDVSTYLPMSQVHDALHQLPCSHFLGILDCCFAGSFRWSSTRKLMPLNLDIIHKERFDRFIQDPAWQIITSAAHDQAALDAFSLQGHRGQVGRHSPFAAALIEALEGKADAYPPAEPGKPAGDGVITATELYVYLRDRVEVATEACALRQTPGIHGLKKHDKGEYIFLVPGHELNLPSAPPLDELKNPYRGLRSFEENHSELFFGRSELIEKLHDFVKTHPLTVVLGASGSGKSSLVKAGLIPKLKEAQDTDENWCILSPIRLGEAPLQALNNALVTAQLAGIELHNPHKTLAQSIAVWAKKNSNTQLLIFIDQSEEIITLCSNEAERQEFFQQILTAIDAHRERLRIVLSLRSDFEPQVRDISLKFAPEAFDKLGHGELKNRWQCGRFIVPAMTRAELREAIEKPAEARVMYFQPHNLVEQIVDEVADMPGALPLLSFALSELYLKYLERQREAQHRGSVIDRALTQKDYHELGGVIHSLTQRADQEYKALVAKDPAYAKVIRHVMLRMIAIGGGEFVRRQVPLSELKYPPEKNGLVKAVIEHFTDARLLVKGEDAEGSSYVEPAHDALVRGWQELLDWVEEEKNLRLQRRLTPAALEWKRQQQPRFLWNADPYLDVLQKEVLHSKNNWLNQVETEFVQRSVAKRSFNTRRNWGVAIAVMLGLTGLTLAALRGQRNALIGQIDASRQSSEAGLRTNNLTLDTLIQSLQAGTSSKDWLLKLVPPDSQLRNQFVATLRSAVLLNREQQRWQLPQGEAVVDTIVGRDGKLLVATTTNEGICVRDLNNESVQEFCEEVHKVPENLRVTIAKFSPDGTKLVFTLRDSETGEQVPIVYLWNWTNDQFHKSSELPGEVWNVSFSLDSKALALIVRQDSQSAAYWWNWEDERLNQLIDNVNVEAINFKRDDGSLLVATTTKDDNKTVSLWSYNSGEFDFVNQFELENASDSNGIASSAISPNGESLVVGVWKHPGVIHGQLWRVEDRVSRDLGELTIANYRTIANYSPDGTQLAVADSDNTVHLLNGNYGYQEQEFRGHQGDISSLSFSSYGKQLLTGGDDNTIRLWSTDEMVELSGLRHQKLPSSAQTLSFSSDGKQLATLEDNQIHLWDLLSVQRLRKFPQEYDPESELIFDRKGRHLAIVEPNAVRLLNLETGQEELTMPGEYDSVRGLSFNLDGTKLAILAGSNLHVLDLESKQELAKRDCRYGDSGWAADIIWKSDGKEDQLLVAVASTDNIVQTWDFFSCKQQTSLDLRLGDAEMGIIGFTDDGASILIEKAGDRIILWDWQSNHPIYFSESGIISRPKFRRISPDGRVIATIDENGQAILWQLGGLDELLKEGCERVRGYLASLDETNSDRHLCDGIN
ncbi:caspase family protein [Phormidium tenue FACHB-886]|nr:caspase family protein [Phormidium tenue FACHB-886]